MKFSLPKAELAESSMHKDYTLLMFIKSKIK